MVCPCRDCGKRELYCHAKCEPYIEYVKKRREYLESRRFDGDITSAKILSAVKQKKKKNKKNK